MSDISDYLSVSADVKCLDCKCLSPCVRTSVCLGLQWGSRILSESLEIGKTRIFYIFCLALCWLCWGLVVWGVIAKSGRVSVNTHARRAKDVVATAEMALCFRERCKQHFYRTAKNSVHRTTLIWQSNKAAFFTLQIYREDGHLIIRSQTSIPKWSF